jgi:transmembrane sensor
MANSTASDLFRKYLDNRITPEELSDLYRLVNEHYDPEALEQALGGSFHAPPSGLAGEVDPEEVFAVLRARIEERRRTIPLYRRRWVAVAAGLLLLLAAGTTIWEATRKSKAPPAATQAFIPVKNDVSPGHAGAILTLAGGQKIVLDSAHNGSLAVQGTTTITLQKNGQLDYSASGGHPGELLYNTLTTPRARTTSVVLADGTQVWLNAASFIRFPAAFAGKERRVEISGEVYFEIKKDASRPFVVTRSGTDESIEVLGTHFNVNAYDDEDAMRTTLLEGSVKVIRGKNSNLLMPGQQAVLGNNSHDIQVIDDARLDEVMAWRNGRFIFSHMDLKTIMRQLTRWYDVDVTYEGKVPEISIGGIMHSDVYLSTVMEFLGENGVHYKMEGKKITILQ